MRYYIIKAELIKKKDIEGSVLKKVKDIRKFCELADMYEELREVRKE